MAVWHAGHRAVLTGLDRAVTKIPKELLAVEADVLVIVAHTVADLEYGNAVDVAVEDVVNRAREPAMATVQLQP